MQIFSVWGFLNHMAQHGYHETQRLYRKKCPKGLLVMHLIAVIHCLEVLPSETSQSAYFSCALEKWQHNSSSGHRNSTDLWATPVSQFRHKFINAWEPIPGVAAMFLLHFLM